MFCPHGFNTCNVTLASRERFRKNNTDASALLVFLFVTAGIDAASLACRKRLRDTSPRRSTTVSRWRRLRPVVRVWSGSRSRETKSATSSSTLRTICRRRSLAAAWTLTRIKVESLSEDSGALGRPADFLVKDVSECSLVSAPGRTTTKHLLATISSMEEHRNSANMVSGRA